MAALLSDSRALFTGIVLPAYDREAIFGGVLAMGGQYREDLVQDVTHLVCLAPDGEKYRRALGEPNMKIVLPHWVNECFKLRRLVQEEPFQFPDTPYLRTTHQALSKEGTEAAATQEEEEDAAKNINQQIYPYPESIDYLPTLPEPSTFLKDQCFYLSLDLDISEEFRNALQLQLVNAGATVANDYDSSVDVVVTQFRSSDSYLRGCQQGKVVGSLWWLTNTLARQRFQLPTRALLDYPLPKGGIPGMEKAVITITSYNGIARDLLRRLIIAVGATFSPDMDKSLTTHVISASPVSQKHRVGQEWDLHVVNHLWLEECFQQWKCKSVANERYVHFPAGKLLNDLVGQTQLLPEELDRWWRNLDQIPEVISAELTQEYGPQDSGEIFSRASDDESDIRISRSPSVARTDSLFLLSSPSPGPGSRRGKRSHQATLDESQPSDTQTTSASSQREFEIKRTKVEDSQKKSLSERAQADTEEDIVPQSPQSTRQSSQRRGKQRGTEQGGSAAVRIITSGFTLSREQQTALQRLGAQVTEVVEQATHLVVEARVLRTPKFLCAVNLGLMIVRLGWIKDSIKKHQWQDEAAYAVKDPENEKRYKFNLSDSLSIARAKNTEFASARHRAWLEGWDICLLQPSKNVLKEVIETAGGKVVSRTYARKLRDRASDEDAKARLLLISDPKEKDDWPEFTTHGYSVYDMELLIVGSLRQQLDLDEFRLD
ncbi:hypothetical protein EC973_002683 [Apophysomyces ossiformis]|uniref:BRCT domain-containing protein n=1 Tax=Apophysomyces ossiformis TaxID=679940 RepID=A0A8H7BMB5_9FUNG|nr:hypothetical protein EC973_002683 [Apophysomyces ossiformis]